MKTLLISLLLVSVLVGCNEAPEHCTYSHTEQQLIAGKFLGDVAIYDCDGHVWEEIL